MTTFVAIGGDYAKVGNSGARFTLPYDATIAALLKPLKDADILTSRKSGESIKVAVE